MTIKVSGDLKFKNFTKITRKTVTILEFDMVLEVAGAVGKYVYESK